MKQEDVNGVHITFEGAFSILLTLLAFMFCFKQVPNVANLMALNIHHA